MPSVRFTILVLLFSLAGQTLAESGGGTPYFEIPKPFVVNIQGEDPITFLQVNAQLETSERTLKAKLREHLPIIRHTMILLLSEQNTKTIRSMQGKESLRKAAVKELQTVLKEQVGKPTVDNVYFTGFIIQ